MHWFSDFNFSLCNGGVHLSNPYQHILKIAIGENQTVLESSGYKDLESRRLQFGRGNLTKVSQSNTHTHTQRT